MNFDSFLKRYGVVMTPHRMWGLPVDLIATSCDNY